MEKQQIGEYILKRIKAVLLHRFRETEGLMVTRQKICFENGLWHCRFQAIFVLGLFADPSGWPFPLEDKLQPFDSFSFSVTDSTHVSIRTTGCGSSQTGCMQLSGLPPYLQTVLAHMASLFSSASCTFQWLSQLSLNSPGWPADLPFLQHHPVQPAVFESFDIYVLFCWI